MNTDLYYPSIEDEASMESFALEAECRMLEAAEDAQIEQEYMAESLLNETKLLNDQLASLSLESLVDGSLSDLVITTRRRINDNIEKIHAATGMELWEITEATYA